MKRSVNTNLLSLVAYISAKLDRNVQVDVVYFDFRKAFDRVNNDILLEKLSTMGFSPGLLHFIADYLRDRQQYVRLGMYDSQPYHTRSGVSQGSILGPLLFTLMINDLPSVIKHAKCLLYADDLKLFYEIRTVKNCLELQSDIDAVHRWSIANKMDFNLSKCFQMTFGRMRHPIEFQYQLGDSTISRVQSIKDLGVAFDRELTFNGHIVTVAKEAYQRLGFVLRNAKDFKNIEVIKLLYSTLVRTKLEASSCVWHPHEDNYTLILEKVQKAFLRFLYKRLFRFYPYMYPTPFLLGSLGYNSLEARRTHNQLIIMCKVLHGKVDAPDLTEQICCLYVPDEYVRGRKHKLFAVPRYRTVSHFQSPILRSLTAFNAILSSERKFDVFADDWKIIIAECLRYGEITSNNTSSIQ